MDNVQLERGNCIEVLNSLDECSVDSVVCDPPYEIGFMGNDWDRSGIAFNPETWKACLRILKPGGHLLAFGGSRTYHRMACAVEDAGFEIRDQIMWLYGSGFPKSLDVSKAIDKAAGAEREITGTYKTPNGRDYTLEPKGKAPRFDALMGTTSTAEPRLITAPATDAAKQWSGWGTALKPAHEPIVVARKPLIGTVVANVLEHSTGALNIDECRVTWPDGKVPEIGTPGWGGPAKKLTVAPGQEGETVARSEPSQLGRWPANIIHDGSDEVLGAFPDALGQQAPVKGNEPSSVTKNVFGERKRVAFGTRKGETASAARFFYCAKPSKKERNLGLDASFPEGNKHPTVKPVELMRYLVRLITPPGGLVVDPFLGSGTTGVAAVQEGFRFLGIDLDTENEWLRLAGQRIAAAGNSREANPE